MVCLVALSAPQSVRTSATLTGDADLLQRCVVHEACGTCYVLLVEAARKQQAKALFLVHPAAAVVCCAARSYLVTTFRARICPLRRVHVTLIRMRCRPCGSPCLDDKKFVVLSSQVMMRLTTGSAMRSLVGRTSRCVTFQCHSGTE